MAVLTRIVAAATILSLAFADIAGASAAENYALAAKGARARHNERAARVNAAGGEIKKRNVQKRCSPATTSTLTTSKHSTTSPAKQVVSTTSHHTTTTKVVTKTTSKAPATTSKAAASNPPSGDTMKGLAWGGSNNQLSAFTNTGKIGFLYNWGATPPIVDGIMSCSMFWGTKNQAAFEQNRSKYPCIMAFNEPNLAAQADLSAGAAASLWKAQGQPYAGGKTVIAPAVTTATDGIQWLKDFFNDCDGCDFTYIPAHVYDTDATKVMDYITTLHTTFGKPILVTEFACQAFYGNNQDATSSEAQAFMKTLVAWFEATSYVAGYAPFGFSQDTGNVNSVNALIGSNGQPTTLAEIFLNTY